MRSGMRDGSTHARALTLWDVIMAVTLPFYTTASGIERARVPVLSCSSAVHLYTIPSFPVVQVRLKQIQFQALKPDGSSIHVDGFIRDDPSLNRIYPAELSVAVPTGYTFCYGEL